MKSILVLGGCLIALAACETPSQTGTAFGAGAGGLVGAAIGGPGAALFGAAMGGMLGYGVGRSQEIENQRRVEMALAQGRAEAWQGQSGSFYRVEPRRSFYSNGQLCRDFHMLARIDRGPEEIYGVACQQPDGTWRVVSSD